MMFDFGTIFYWIWIAIISTLLFLLVEQVSSPKLRIVLPLACGMSLFFFIVVLNPQYETGLVYQLRLLGVPLLEPFFIIASVPLIEKREKIVFGKFSVFSGALVTMILFFIISQTGFHLAVRQSQFEILFGEIGLLIISSLVFYGISRIQQFRFQSSGEKSGTPPNNHSPQSGKLIIIVIVASLIAFCSPYFLLEFYGHLQDCGSFSVMIADESSLTSESRIIHLTEKDFREFPPLETIIKNAHDIPDSSQNRTDMWKNTIGNAKYSCNQERILDKYKGTGPSSNEYLEYGGNYYYFGPWTVY